VRMMSGNRADPLHPPMISDYFGHEGYSLGCVHHQHVLTSIRSKRRLTRAVKGLITETLTLASSARAMAGYSVHTTHTSARVSASLAMNVAAARWSLSVSM
jgi:hypothetical protein